MLTFEDKVFLVDLINVFMINLGALIIVLYILYGAFNGVLHLSSQIGYKLGTFFKMIIGRYKTKKVLTIEK